MSPRARKKPEPRTPLNREKILRAAVAFVDVHGLESLSMRRLAGELGFKVMALYNHISGKDDMLDGALDLIAGEMDPPQTDKEWKQAIRESSISVRKVLLSHPWAAQIWSNRDPGPYRLRYMEALLRSLREAGFSSDLTYRVFHLINVYTLGFTLNELNFQFAPEDLEEKAQEFLPTLPEDEFPYLIEHIHQHLDDHDDEDEEFQFGLDLILNSLEHTLKTSQG